MPIKSALVYAGIAVLAVVTLIVAWYALDVLLLGFIGVLVAILLRAPADALAARTPLSPNLSLAIVCVIVFAGLGALLWLFGRTIAAQSLELFDRLPQIIETAKEGLRSTDAGERAVRLAEESGALESSQGHFLGRGLGMIGATFGALAHMVIIIFFGVFLAAQPKIYIRGILHLVPKPQRPRARELLGEMGSVLRRWLVGQSLLAAVVATITGVGLMLIGAPFALPLAILAGLMEFVPYIGPFVSAVPAIVIGFGEGAQVALWIALLYLAVQVLESYILAPLIQHRAVELAPALVLFAQVLMGVLAGPLGVVVATPLAAVTLVAVKMLYVEDGLGDEAV
ncbi:MAG TPA: AI-2E family transporter [Burkholderiales bacterium]|nr:AI-2E family transporter [Burkholderiales bacterium]